MIYEIENLPRRMPVDLIDSALTFACVYLDLDIDLMVEFESLPKFQCGFCDYNEDDVTIVIAKRLSRREMIRTIFHELVHVKQYADGRLEAGAVCRWYGAIYDCDYNELPWEIEAFDLEEKMMKEFENEL